MVVVVVEDEPKHQEGDIARLVIERIETRTSIAHFPPGYHPSVSTRLPST